MLRSAQILLGLSLAASAVTAGDPPNRSEILAAAREVMAAARFCTLVTLDETGHPTARVMDPFPAEEDFTVWMATNSATRKVAHLKADPRATLLCFDPEGIAYVTLLGAAGLVDDQAERERRFKPGWSEFYEDEHRGDDYLLIRFVPFRLEMVSIGHGIAAEPRGWEPAVIDLDSAP